MTHRWPCVLEFGATLGEVPWLTLKRCGFCGSLWEVEERSRRRTTTDTALSTFGVIVQPFEWVDPGLTRITAVHAQLNQGALVGFALTAEAGQWTVAERGALRMSSTARTDGLTALEINEAVELATTTWGASAGAVLRLALAMDMDHSVLRALDIIQALPVQDWEKAWQPRAAEYAELMVAAGSNRMTKIRTAVDVASARGDLAESDRVAAGLMS